MKKLFALILSIVCTSAFCETSLSDWASKQLENARAEYAKTLSEIEQEQIQKKAHLQKIYEQIKQAQNTTQALECEIETAKNLQNTLDFYKKTNTELRGEIIKIATNNSANTLASGDTLSACQRALNAQYAMLLNSFKPYQTEAIDARTGKKLIGESFFVGGFKYFVSDAVSGFLSEDSLLYGTEFSEKIKRFADGKSDIIPVDTSFGNLLKSQKGETGIAGDIQKGGVWIYPILLLAALSILVAIYKCTQLTLWEHSTAQYREIANVIGNAKNKDQAQENAYCTIAKLSQKLNKNIVVLKITASVAPLFGLLGTVSGIIKTFADLTARTEKTHEISAGIAEALITTEYGLIVAIPALIVATLLSGKIKKILEQTTQFAEEQISAKK